MTLWASHGMSSSVPFRVIPNSIQALFWICNRTDPCPATRGRQVSITCRCLFPLLFLHFLRPLGRAPLRDRVIPSTGFLSTCPIGLLLPNESQVASNRCTDQSRHSTTTLKPYHHIQLRSTAVLGGHCRDMMLTLIFVRTSFPFLLGCVKRSLLPPWPFA